MRSVIIDTDPGQDDAVALLLALASPELDVVAITTVAGNVPLALTTKNALMLVELAGKDVPVAQGAAQPLDRPLVTAEYVHGPTGLDGANLADPRLGVVEESATELIISELRSRPSGSVTLATLGPLTNVAQVLRDAPEVAPKIAEIVLMGGGFSEVGNVTPAAEFNIYVDPTAAHEVFSSGIPLTVMPLDVTHQALASHDRVTRFAALGTPPGDCVAGMLSFFDRYDSEKYGTDGAPLHDPCVIAYLLDPSLFDGRHCNVEIETDSTLTLGMTVVDWWDVTDRQPNATVMRSIDADRFFDLLIERIGQL